MLKGRRHAGSGNVDGLQAAGGPALQAKRRDARGAPSSADRIAAASGRIRNAAGGLALVREGCQPDALGSDDLRRWADGIHGWHASLKQRDG
jgi:hypothetical protein